MAAKQEGRGLKSRRTSKWVNWAFIYKSRAFSIEYSCIKYYRLRSIQPFLRPSAPGEDEGGEVEIEGCYLRFFWVL